MHDWLVEELVVVEANLDDITAEAVAFASERLFAGAGALDVWTTAATMKKSRPGLVLHCLCRPAAAPKALEVLFQETSSIGARVQRVERYALRRSMQTLAVELPLLPSAAGTADTADTAAASMVRCDIRCKVATLDGRVVNAKPEFEDCAAVARQHPSVTLQAVQRAAQAAAGGLWGGSASDP